MTFVNDTAFDHDDLVASSSPFAGQAHTGLRVRTKVAVIFQQQALRGRV
jgi:hypothetical protein